MAEWNSKLENILQKRRIINENEKKNKLQLFIQNSYGLQNLISKI